MKDDAITKAAKQQIAKDLTSKAKPKRNKIRSKDDPNKMEAENISHELIRLAVRKAELLGMLEDMWDNALKSYYHNQLENKRLWTIVISLN